MDPISLLGPLCGCCKFGDCGQEVRHILCPKRRVKMLRTRMDDLNSFKEATQRAVREKIIEKPWSKIHPHVDAWIQSVEDLSALVGEIPQEDLPFWRRFCCCYAYELGDKIEQCLEQIQRQEEHLGYITSNLVIDVFSIPDLKMKLHNEMEMLGATKKDLESEVQELEMAAVFHPMMRSERIELWMRKFVSLQAEVSILVANTESTVTPNKAPAVATPNETTTAAVAEIELKRNIWATINKIVELSEQSTKLKQEGGLVVATPPQPFHELPGDRSDFIVGIEEKLKDVETLLNDGETEVILIHGMGGSGKTTLVRELTKKLRSKGGDGFHFIFSIVVSQNLDVYKIQGDVLAQLGCRRDDQSLPQNIDDRSIFLQRKLNKKSFLLVLDDLWEPLGDLTSKLGFHPPSTSSKRCKVMVTSRKADVCEGRESIRTLKFGLLGKEHAWDLFCRKSGLVESEAHIYTLAKEIAKKCGGLPLLLKTVASAMEKNRNYEDWLDAKDQLHNYPDAIQNMDQVYEVLKFSFDSLENDRLRDCLLYCALFPEDYDISLERTNDWGGNCGLIPYLIAEGFVDGRYDFDTLWKKARSDIIDKLEKSSLLERGVDDDHVKLHDAVRDMVLIWLAKKEGDDCKVLAHSGKGPGGCISVDDSWVGVRMASFMNNHGIKKIVGGEVILQSLRTLLMQGCPISRLPESLFPQLSSLCILDLSWNYFLSEIPKSIGSLRSLRFLNMSRTNIRTLPVEIGNLTNLHTLDLSYTLDLEHIPRVAISPLTMLQSLNLYRCRCFQHEEEDEECKLKDVDVSRLLPKLKDVGLTLLHSIDANVVEKLFPLTYRLMLRGMDIDDVTSSKFLSFQRLKLFYICSCCFPSREVEFRRENFSRLKILHLYKTEGLRNIILTSPLWCLQKLYVIRCDDLEHLGWIQQLPNLVELRAENCGNLQELLLLKHKSERSSDQSSCRNDELAILSKLKRMQLGNLPQLDSISSHNLLFPCLTYMEVQRCPRLRKLPIKSCSTVRTKIRCEMECWESLEWEDDECDSSRFIPQEEYWRV